MADLLIDIGNSRIKWALSHAGKLFAHGAAEHAGTVPAEIDQAWLVVEPPVRVIAANVAGEVYAQVLNDWVQGQWQLEVEFVVVDPDCNEIALAYPDASKFGVDRWLALIAARGLSSADVVVIDAGTAVTVDILSAHGQHLGGIIVPGLRLMRQSLQQKSSAIQQGLSTLTKVKPALLGSDTASGIANGGLYAVAGAIEHLLARVEKQTGARPSVIISGGDAEVVRAELTIKSQYVPDLVLLGMQILEGVCE